MEIISQNEYIKILNQNEHHFKNLIDIIQKNEDSLEENYFFEYLKLELSSTQQNLFTIGKNGNKIINIGFKTGYSTLLFLLSNPHSHIHCFNIYEHTYTQPCFQYLYDNFNKRVSLYNGNTEDTLSLFLKNNPDQSFDIFHIDGSYNSRIANIEFFISYELAHDQSIIIWNNLNNQNFLFNNYISSQLIKPFSLLITPIHNLAYILKPKLRIALCSLTIGEKYKEITKYGRRSKVLYCEKQCYDFFDEETDVDYTRPLAWSKINIIKKHLPDYDYVLWVDGDTLLMNNNIKIENIIKDFSNKKDITVAQDWTMINTGVILLKNTTWTMNFLNLIYEQVEFLNHPNWEQTAFIHLLENNSLDSKNHINVLPLHFQNKINSYWFSYCFNDCFILHFPGCFRDNEENGLIIAMNKYCPIKMDNEDEEQYNKRLYWLEHESRHEIEEQLKRNR